MRWSECKELIRQDYAQLIGNPKVSKRQAFINGGG